jgi:hypothetical protein
MSSSAVPIYEWPDDPRYIQSCEHCSIRQECDQIPLKPTGETWGGPENLWPGQTLGWPDDPKCIQDCSHCLKAGECLPKH